MSEAMYRRSVQWRIARRVDELITWTPPSVLQKYYPWGRAGYDEDNCPVWIIPFGTADVKGKAKHIAFIHRNFFYVSLGILRSASKEDFVDFTIKIVETSLTLMRTKSQEDGSTHVTQHVFIFDLEGFSFGVKAFFMMFCLSDQTILLLQAATNTDTLDIIRQLISIYESEFATNKRLIEILHFCFD